MATDFIDAAADCAGPACGADLTAVAGASFRSLAGAWPRSPADSGEHRRRRPGVVLLALWLMAAQPGAAFAAPAAGDPAPPFVAGEPAGGEFQFQPGERGRVSVVLFWATWCPYCKALMPALQRVAAAHADGPVEFLAVNLWEDGDPVRFLAEHDYQFRLLLAGEAAAEVYGVTGTPGLFVIAPDGRVLWARASGMTPEQVEAAVGTAIREALADMPAAHAFPHLPGATGARAAVLRSAPGRGGPG